MTFLDRPRIILRADGNRQIGLGHIYRCIAIAQMLRNEFNCLLITNSSEEQLIELIKQNCPVLSIDVLENNEEINLLASILTVKDVYVIDGYTFNVEYQNKIKSIVRKLVLIDDVGGEFLDPDIIINHGGTATFPIYKTGSDSTLLLGFDYLILRKEFLDAALKYRSIKKIDSVFICMGGSDPFKVTLKVLNVCLDLHFIKKIIIVTGSGYRDLYQLDRLIMENKTKNILHKNNVSSVTMISLIRDSEIVICPSSSIALEVCSVKAGLLTGIVIDNQLSIHKHLLESEACLSVGNLNTASSYLIADELDKLNDLDLINSMMKRQSVMIDGLSGSRIAYLFKQLSGI